MAKRQSDRNGEVAFDREGLDELIAVLLREGYRVLGPVARDGAIVIDEISSTGDLPGGWTDEQSPGVYRLKRSRDGALFGHVVGPHALKRFLHEPEKVVWKAERAGAQGFRGVASDDLAPPMAFIGVRACDLSALAIQDQVLIEGEYADPDYRERRQQLFIVAVNCGLARSTCFCASMKTGPKATTGFDIALTEVVGKGRHIFVAETGSERGADILGRIGTRAAKPAEIKAARAVEAKAVKMIERKLDTAGIHDLLINNDESPRWDEVADRCLTCGNCTMACPTCFCTTVEDVTDLTGATAERRRRWDSCFTTDFTYIHGGSIRASERSRYRHWITHKLATWIDQFGTSGCVGCGRCIAWCPVGIDITEEAEAIRQGASKPKRKRTR